MYITIPFKKKKKKKKKNNNSIVTVTVPKNYWIV